MTELVSVGLLRVPDDFEILPRLTLHGVEAFVAVAELGSFRRAGERLYMDSSTVSKLVRQLESQLGQQLLMRSTKQVVVTARGHTALAVSKRLLAETRALFDIDEAVAS